MNVLRHGERTIFDSAPYEGMWFGEYIEGTDKANARLIAAAPTMLGALKAARSKLGIGVVRDQIDAAIALAEGETP
jgi:hypothetical protein